LKFDRIVTRLLERCIQRFSNLGCERGRVATLWTLDDSTSPTHTHSHGCQSSMHNHPHLPK